MSLRLWVELFRLIDLHQIEKKEWKVFREQLDKSERKTFDEMMSISRLYNVAGVSCCKPVLLHPILMSIVFEHYKQLEKIKN